MNNLLHRRLHCRYYADEVSQGTRGSCKKDAYTRRQLSPGLFVMWCLCCGNCIGFHMMRDSESPRTLFEVLYTRFPVAPRLVVYDNGCNAHAFALNREPVFFKNTQFMIDALHFKCHTGCCSAYDIKHHAHTRHLNSQLCEQQVSASFVVIYFIRPSFHILTQLLGNHAGLCRRNNVICALCALRAEFETGHPEAALRVHAAAYISALHPSFYSHAQRTARRCR